LTNRLNTRQIILRQLVIISSGIQGDATSVDVIPPAQTLQMAVIVIATVPMLLVSFCSKTFCKRFSYGISQGIIYLDYND